MATRNVNGVAHGWTLVLAAGTGLGILAMTAAAQSTPSVSPPAGAPTPVAATPSPRGTLQKMMRPITVDLNEQRLEDVMRFISEFTGAPLEPLWTGDNQEGLDKDALITIKATNVPALSLVERILGKVKTQFSESTWQMTKYGAMEVGPKSLLNKSRRVELYDINDLLFEIPTYAEVPQIDLQSLLQQSQGGGGGGGGRNPFTNDQQRNQQNKDELAKRRQERQDNIVTIITSLVEPDQWDTAGGEGATIRFFQGQLIVNAPDYIHRQLNGYPYWPSYTSSVVKGRRYVTLDVDPSLGKVDKVSNFPITPPPR